MDTFIQFTEEQEDLLEQQGKRRMILFMIIVVVFCALAFSSGYFVGERHGRRNIIKEVEDKINTRKMRVSNVTNAYFHF